MDCQVHEPSMVTYKAVKNNTNFRTTNEVGDATPCKSVDFCRVKLTH